MAKKKKSKAKKATTRESLVVGTKARAYLKGTGKKADVNVASDALDGLNAVVYHYLDQAKARAKANGRKTIRSHDFMA